jgi:hypothetical protein
MNIPDLIRYGAWGGVVATAEANRRHYRMTTTWLPHLLTNTVALLLPDLHRLLARRPAGTTGGPPTATGPAQLARLGSDTLAALVRDNPAYVAYVLPLAAGYLLSNPHFTIYKGRAAELRLGGFGLDALPHAATAFALTALVGDALRAASELSGGQAGPLQAALRHEAAVTALALAAATLLWEVGEHRIHQHELGQRGSAEAINMQWSPEDTLYDCLSNLLGWAAATLWRRRQGGPPEEVGRPAAPGRAG